LDFSMSWQVEPSSRRATWNGLKLRIVLLSMLKCVDGTMSNNLPLADEFFRLLCARLRPGALARPQSGGGKSKTTILGTGLRGCASAMRAVNCSTCFARTWKKADLACTAVGRAFAFPIVY